MTLEAVSETAVITLRARADEHRRADRWFADPRAAAWSERLPWPAASAKAYSAFTQAKTALRAHQIDRMVGALVPAGSATVVELGAGFSTRGDRIAAPWIGLDLPGVVEARRALGDEGELVATSVLDPAWLDRVPAGPVVFVAEGLLYYLPRAAVDELLAALAARWPGAPLIMDVIGALDFGKSVKATARLGAPIQWAIDPPFEAAFPGLFMRAVADVPGLDPETVLWETVDGFAQRFGPLLGASLRAVTHVPLLRARRSGIMAGYLTQAR